MGGWIGGWVREVGGWVGGREGFYLFVEGVASLEEAVSIHTGEKEPDCAPHICLNGWVGG